MPRNLRLLKGIGDSEAVERFREKEREAMAEGEPLRPGSRAERNREAARIAIALAAVAARKKGRRWSPSGKTYKRPTQEQLRATLRKRRSLGRDL